MQLIRTDLPGVVVVEPKVHGDERGFFIETWREEWAAAVGARAGFVQDNHSRSKHGVLRGLHYQLAHPQAKLVRVARGEVFDVAVDIRRGSPTFGRWYGTVLSDRNGRQMYLPAGFAHGFCVLSPEADFEYKCSDYYFPDDQYGIAWDDPAIGIDWPLAEPLLSAKDRELPVLGQVSESELPTYEPER